MIPTTLACEDSAWGGRCCWSCPPPQAAREAACLLFTAWHLLLPLGFWAWGLLAHRSKPSWNGAGCSECQDECPEDGGDGAPRTQAGCLHLPFTPAPGGSDALFWSPRATSPANIHIIKNKKDSLLKRKNECPWELSLAIEEWEFVDDCPAPCPSGLNPMCPQ